MNRVKIQPVKLFSLVSIEKTRHKAIEIEHFLRLAIFKPSAPLTSNVFPYKASPFRKTN